jgi:hypothetical protein
MPIKVWPDWHSYVEGCCRCVYCDLDGTQDIRLYRQMQIDHLIPRLANDRDLPLNKVVACHGCNSTKGRYDPSENGEIPLTSETRPMLIDKARREIERRYKANWDLDYEEMKDAIRTSAA